MFREIRGGGGGSGSFCDVLCGSCAGGTAECLQSCNEGIGQVPGELDGCPSELDTLGQCLGANDCTNADSCDAEWTAWFTCIITSGIAAPTVTRTNDAVETKRTLGFEDQRRIGVEIEIDMVRRG